MKERSILISVGILLYVLLSATDRFITDIPDAVYIPLALAGIALIIVGMIRDKKRRNKK